MKVGRSRAVLRESQSARRRYCERVADGRRRIRVRLSRRAGARAGRSAWRAIAGRSCSPPTLPRATNTSSPCSRGVWVTLDNIHPLREWPQLFEGQRGVRARRYRPRARAPRSRAHGWRAHEVRCAAVRARGARAPGAGSPGRRVVGLHAHTGSGIFNARNWIETAELLTDAAAAFPAGADRGCGRRPRNTGASRAAYAGPAGSRRGVRAGAPTEPGGRAVARAGPVHRGGGGRAAGAGYAAQGQRRGPLCRASRPA